MSHSRTAANPQATMPHTLWHCNTQWVAFRRTIASCRAKLLLKRKRNCCHNVAPWCDAVVAQSQATNMPSQRYMAGMRKCMGIVAHGRFSLDAICTPFALLPTTTNSCSGSHQAASSSQSACVCKCCQYMLQFPWHCLQFFFPNLLLGARTSAPNFRLPFVAAKTAKVDWMWSFAMRCIDLNMKCCTVGAQ